VSTTIIQGVLTVAAKQQPCGVQVVEWVGLVASGFQILLGLAAVFAEEVGGSTISQSVVSLLIQQETLL